MPVKVIGGGILKERGAAAAFDKTSLISWWDLEEASGTRFDAHGSNDLTDNNTVTQAVGIVGNCASFVRTNTEYLSITSNASLQVGDIDFTIACWVYFGTLGNYHALVRKSAALPNSEYALYKFPDNRLYFDVSDGVAIGAVYADTFGVVTSGVWYFIVCGHDSVNDKVFISVNDGVADTTSWAAGVQAKTNPFTLSDLSSPMTGRLDSVGFLKRALTAAERTWLYNGGAGRQYSDL